MDDELRFLEYKQHIKECVRQIQLEMSLGNIRSEEVLQQNIDRVSQFTSSVKAFTFFQNSAPYEWTEIITRKLLKKHQYDLSTVIMEAVNKKLAQDLYTELSQTDAYRFLTDGMQTKKIRWKIDGEDCPIKLREMWKSRASLFDHLSPYQLVNYKGKTLAIYKRDEDTNTGEVSFTFLLEHTDPALIWKSKKHFSEPKQMENSVDYYEEQKCEILLHYGCPQDQLWLVEVQKSGEFNEQHCTESESEDDFYGLQDYEYVVYHHESGTVNVHARFNEFEEFEIACKMVAEYLKE
jgi:hypothetical protein